MAFIKRTFEEAMINNGQITYLKDGEHGNRERVKVGWRRSIRKVEGSAEQLHPQEGKDEDEEEKQK